MLFEVSDGHVRPFSSKGDRHSLSYPAVTSGDERHPALEATTTGSFMWVARLGIWPHLILPSGLPVLGLRRLGIRLLFHFFSTCSS